MKIVGEVVHGKKRGRLLGFPTANVIYKGDSSVDAVYVCCVGVGDCLYPGVGTYLHAKELFEVHLLDVDEDLYGKVLTIDLVKKVRENMRFAHVDGLMKQIADDVMFARAYREERNSSVGC